MAYYWARDWLSRNGVRPNDTPILDMFGECVAKNVCPGGRELYEQALKMIRLELRGHEQYDTEKSEVEDEDTTRNTIFANAKWYRHIICGEPPKFSVGRVTVVLTSSYFFRRPVYSKIDRYLGITVPTARRYMAFPRDESRPYTASFAAEVRQWSDVVSCSFRDTAHARRKHGVPPQTEVVVVATPPSQCQKLIIM